MNSSERQGYCLIPYNDYFPENAPSSDWYKELRNAYKPFMSYSDYNEIKDYFGELFSLFPFIRKIERSTRVNQTTSANYLLAFAAVITDQGLLAEQTRDGGKTAEGLSSRVHTIVGPISLSPSKLSEARELYKLQIFSEVKHTINLYFKNNDLIDSYEYLLDSFSLVCSKNRKSVQQVFHAPKRQKPDPQTQVEDDDDTYPDEYEKQFAENAQIIFSKSNAQPALTYFKNLTLPPDVVVPTDDEYIFFIDKILPSYVYKISSHNPYRDKHFKPHILNKDIPKLKQQAKDCSEMYVLLLTAQTIANLSQKNSTFKQPFPEENMENFINLFLQHDKLCISCHTRTSTREDYCRNFADRIKQCWPLIRGNPFLIFRLWTTNAQNSFTETRIASLNSLLSNRYKPFHKWTDSNASEADRTLYSGLLSFCLPLTSDENLAYAYWQLFEAAANNDVSVSEICNQRVNQYILSCLPFLPGDLYADYKMLYFNPDLTYNDFREWLESPSVLDEATRILNLLPKDSSDAAVDPSMPTYDELFHTFKELMERLTLKVWHKWDKQIKAAANHPEWNDTDTSYLEILHSFKSAKRAYRRFLISWIFLQKLRTNSKELLHKIYHQLVESPTKHAITND